VQTKVQTNPTELQRLEKAGELLAKVKQTENEQTSAQQRAVEHQGQMPPLSPWEIAEVYGGPSHRL